MTVRPRIAVLISHGQPSAPPPSEIHLAAIAAAVSDHLPEWEVRSATLASRGFLDAAMTQGAVIYPFFMARGWFTAKVLPERLQQFDYRMACPFGLDPNLPAAAAAALHGDIAARGWPAQGAEVLLAAHGSARGPKAAMAAEAFAERLRAALPSHAVRTGYVEQAPFIAEAAHDLGPYALCLPFFAQSGEHVRVDIPQALQEAGFHGVLLPALGALATTPRLIAQAIKRAELSPLTAATVASP